MYSQPAPASTRDPVPTIPAGPYATTRKVDRGDGSFDVVVSGGGKTVVLPGRTYTAGGPPDAYDTNARTAKYATGGALALSALTVALKLAGVDIGAEGFIAPVVGGVIGAIYASRTATRS